MTARAFNLDKLTELLRTDRRYKNDVRVLEEYSSACSIYRDLESAWASIMLIHQHESDDYFRANMAQALMMHAVITYSRALISRTDRRRRIDVVGKAFSPAQRKLHDAIADLRSTAMAHYHKPLGPFAAEWITDTTAFVIDNEVVKLPQDFYRRHNYKKEAAEALFGLTEAALSYVSSEKKRRQEAVHKFLLSAVGDKFIKSKFEECEFDPRKVLVDDEAVTAFWSGGHSRSERLDSSASTVFR